MHLHGGEIYEIAWDMVMGNKKPKNEYEKNIYENMKNRTEYFQRFKTKEIRNICDIPDSYYNT